MFPAGPHNRRSFLQRAALGASAVAGASAPSRAAGGLDHQHAGWTALLRAYVHEGNVAYGELSGESRALDAYLATLHAVGPAEYGAFTPAQKMAFWINAYNAHVVKLVTENHPVDSVRSIGLLPGSALRRSSIPLRALGPEDLSLNDMANKVLPAFGDARVHLACAPGAAGGPLLRAGAYRADALHAQLEDAACRFLDDPGHVAVDAARGSLTLSEVLEWHRGQLESEAGSLAAFVGRHASSEQVEALRARGRVWKVTFRPVNWALNGH
jgi:hypothetical protein